jgi:hypothetical protein
LIFYNIFTDSNS